jgi:glycosyltransferase involved in cell wall biosynthesis
VVGLDNRHLVSARSRRLRRLLADDASDLIISMGSTFSCPRLDATYEDQTVAQSFLPAGAAKDRWIRRQASIYQHAAHCLTSTPWVSDSIINDYGIPESKVTSVGLGANVLCRARAKDWERPRLLWVGVDWSRKGGDLLLSAFAKAELPGASLDLVGRHPRIDSKDVRGHGEIRDEAHLRTFFEEATLFVLPSRFDPSPIVFLEAASAGTPSLGTDTGGTRYNIGAGGEVVPPNDIDALVQMLRHMTRPSVAEAYGAKAVAHAEDHTWDAVAERVLRALGTPQ